VRAWVAHTTRRGEARSRGFQQRVTAIAGPDRRAARRMASNRADGGSERRRETSGRQDGDGGGGGGCWASQRCSVRVCCEGWQHHLAEVVQRPLAALSLAPRRANHALPEAARQPRYHTTTRRTAQHNTTTQHLPHTQHRDIATPPPAVHPSTALAPASWMEQDARGEAHHGPCIVTLAGALLPLLRRCCVAAFLHGSIVAARLSLPP